MNNKLVTVHTEQIDESRAEITTKADDLLDAVQNYEIVGDSSRSSMVKIMNEAAALKKAIKELWDPVCSATNQAHKTSTAARGKMLNPVEKAERIAKDKVKAWDMLQIEAAREKQKEAESASDRNVAVPDAPKPDDITYVDNWKARVTDESKLDRQYMVPDMEKLTKLAKAMKGENAPDGVEFFNDPIPRRR